MGNDTDLVSWLEEAHGLHTSVRVLYVVDGYDAAFCVDDDPVVTAHGVDFRGALRKLRAEVQATRKGPSWRFVK